MQLRTLEDDLTGPQNAVVDLLGVLAYGTLIGFDRMAADARLAPDLRRRAVLSVMAADEMRNYELLARRLEEIGADPESAMAPFAYPLEAFHRATAPRSWLEGLVKAYVGDGIADDFYREVAEFLPEEADRRLVRQVLHDTRHADFAVAEVRAAIDGDPMVAGRLALWARRLVGEAFSQAQHVAAEREALTDLIIEGSGDINGIGELFKRLTSAHSSRMKALGLSN
ncbi:ferritin-like fold-containing protein [Fodinicola acaciae]|uniref:ferritin-like fold-containing protein n=1 Tax=Fodinicola acaciae TaxID=2681555 RepID=UPI001C9E5D01|nr:ferritin-like fold-containing protein [Fodinicola acaciae]